MLAALSTVDAVALGLLVAFGAWGAWQGPLRLITAFAFLAAAFPLAQRLGPSVEGAVVKAVSVTDAQAVPLAWAIAFLGVLLGGGLLFAVLRPFLMRLAKPGAGRRVLAGLLGLLHGAVLLSLLVYGVLIAFPGAPWAPRLEASRSAAVSRVLTRGVRDVIPMPAWLRDAAARVDRRIP